MRVPEELRCLEHGEAFQASGSELKWNDTLTCPAGCAIPVRRGVPRFTDDGYSKSFGLQWKLFRRTQLDSATGVPLSRDRLARCLGGSLDVLRDKSVLEVGCGAGRFTEVMLTVGARVFACDLSAAVEANYKNCGRWPGYFVCQADLRKVPVLRESFDVVVALGVLQHTPDTDAAVRALITYLRPGGLLVIDHYDHSVVGNASQRFLRRVLCKLPSSVALGVTIGLGGILLPIHSLLWHQHWRLERARERWRKISPLVDYYDSVPQLRGRGLRRWCLLDTHDLLTDYYRHLRSVEEIAQLLKECRLTDIDVRVGGNGVEARARKAIGIPLEEAVAG